MSLLLFHTGAAANPWQTSIGINFRDSAIYATDSTGETYCLGAPDDVYPISPRTITGTSETAVFGWDNVVNDMGRDRDSGLDRRLAGQNQAVNSGTQTTFTLDLPSSGTYTIRLAIGDGTNGQSLQYVRILDDTTPVLTIADATGTSAASFDDATGTEYSAANWPGSNTAVTGLVFATSTLKLVLGDPTGDGGSSSSTIAHLYVEKESAAAAAPKRLTMLGVG